MEDGQPYIVTEFVKGKTLSQLLRERGKLTVNEVLPVMHQVCEAVEEAHRLKIVHRDLKPENIILTEPDQRLTGNTKHNWRTRRIKVVDFGVAKLSSDANSSSASLTVEGKVCGSPGYMSPEQCKGLPVDVRSDIYSLGIVLYEVLSGHRPFSADTVMGLLFMHVNEQPPMMNALCLDLNLPGALETVIRKALNKAPEERQQNVQELWQEFEAACHGKTKTPEKAKAASNWIPFGGIEGKILKEEAQRLALIDTPVTTPIDDPELDLSPYEEIEYEEAPTPWLSRPTMISLSLAVVAIIAMASTNMFPFRILLPDPQLQQADALIQQGKLPDALIAIERMRKQKRGSSDDTEDINKLYLAVADKYSQKKDYSGALESLQRVPAKSKYFQKAMQMASKYRKLASAE
jgi:serine/threonine protein kinase